MAKGLAKLITFLPLALAASLFLTGCGGGVSTPKVGTVILHFTDAAKPEQNVALTGTLTLGGTVAELAGSASATFSGISYGTYALAGQLGGYILYAPKTLTLRQSRLEEEAIIIPENDLEPPRIAEVRVLYPTGREETYFPGETFSISRSAAIEIVFSEYVLGNENLDLGPVNWQLTRNKLTIPSSLSWDPGSQTFISSWMPGSVVALPLSGIQDYSSNSISDSEPLSLGISNDTTLPAAPTDLSVVSTGEGGRLDLSWAPSGEADLWGYLVFREIKDEGYAAELITPEPIMETSLVDSSLTNGLTYQYWVCSVDLNGNISKQSNVVPATPASPQRGIIVYASDRRDVIDATSDFDLYLKYYASSQDGVRIDRLTFPNSSSNEDCPVWSPDGRKIAYVSTSQAESYDLYIADIWVDRSGNEVVAASGDPRRLTMTFETEFAPTWSPDGRKLAYVSYSGDKNNATSSEIRVMEASSGRIWTLVADGRLNEEPDWRPQGDKLAYCAQEDYPDLEESFWQIYLVGSDGGPSNLLRPDISDLGDDRDPAFSPDGRRIAFSSTRGYGPVEYQYANIWVMDLDGNATRVTSGSVVDSAPTWSPDGQEIIFTRMTADKKEAIYRVSAGGSSAPVLVDEYLGNTFTGIPEARNWLPNCAK